MDLPCPRRVDPIHQSPRTRMYGYFTHRTVPPSPSLLIWFLLFFPILFACRLPPPIPLPIFSVTGFHLLQVSGRRWRACALATVRRPNCTCGFPAYSFHEDALL